MTQTCNEPTPSLPAANAGLAIVLLSRGAAYAGGLAELSDLATQLEARLAAAQTPVLRVQPAFVDRAQPALPEALDLCADADQILILPVMVPDEPSLRRWLHKLIMRWRAKQQVEGQPGKHAPRIVFAQPLLQLPTLAELLAATIPSALQQPDVPQLLADEDWERDPKAWSQVPEHQHHVLWCVGPRCAAKGAVALWPQLARTVQQNPLLKKQVMLLQTSCQYPCNHGPLMIAYPEGVWYGPMDATTIEPVLTAHVQQHDCPHEHLRVHGPRPALHESVLPVEFPC